MAAWGKHWGFCRKSGIAVVLRKGAEMSDKKPLAGEWWEKEGVRLLVVGTKRSGITVGEHECGSIDLVHHQHDWQHLPDCTGWDWQPETFPQYWSTFGGIASVAYVEQVSKKEFREVLKDGTVNPIARNGSYSADGRKRLTREQAEALVQKPEPVESPDDWVTQDVVPFRPNLDQRRWVTATGGIACDWEFVDEITTAEPVVHGALNKCSNRLEIRCRRKHLPPPKPNYVRLWTHRTSGTVCTATDEKYLKYPDIWTELKHDGTGFYLAAD